MRRTLVASQIIQGREKLLGLNGKSILTSGDLPELPPGTGRDAEGLVPPHSEVEAEAAHREPERMSGCECPEPHYVEPDHSQPPRYGWTETGMTLDSKGAYVLAHVVPAEPIASRDGEVAAALDVETLRQALIEEQGPQRVSIARPEPRGVYREWAERLAAIYARLAAPSVSNKHSHGEKNDLSIHTHADGSLPHNHGGETLPYHKI